MVTKKRVLVTGMSGQIGGIIRKHSGEKYELSGLDRVSAEGVPMVVADLSDLEAVRPAFEGVDTVVHLGADPSPRAPWDSILQNNIVGTRNVFEASMQAGVQRVVFASSNHVVGFYPLKQDPYKAVYEGRLGEVRRPIPMLSDQTLRPDSYYGVSKAFGEALGSYYHDQHGISVTCVSPSQVVPTPGTVSDSCPPFTSSVTTTGVVADNPNTVVDEGVGANHPNGTGARQGSARGGKESS